MKDKLHSLQIVMPKLGLTMTHGTITEWLKEPGSSVRAEEPLCTYETEKVTLELTAPGEGVLTEILVPAGETVAAGTPVCVIRTAEAASFTEATALAAADVLRPGAQPAMLPTPAPPERAIRPEATPRAKTRAHELGVDLRSVVGSGPGGRIQVIDILAKSDKLQESRRTEGRATPLARRIAGAEGLDLEAIAGTGPGGTITRQDVEAARQQAAHNAPPPGLQETVIPLTAIRRAIGEHMAQSAFSAPHVTLMTEAEASNLVSTRAQLNEELSAGESDSKISFNTLLAALLARALREHPLLNSRLEPDGIHLLPQINIALAVESERGLVTPVLRGVDRLSLAAIQRGYDELAGRAMAGKSLPEDFEGGTFTLTNLGSLDVDGFTPIINPPQAAILGLGRIVDKPVARDGAAVIRPMTTLSLSFDHRIVDGAPAARFLQRVKQLVERPVALLLGQQDG